MCAQTVIYLITVAVVSIDCRSLSENVTKSDKTDDLFPAWVPFKNKHGEELGEFLQVPTKKPKKRLAMPFNFALKSISEPEPEDYFEKSQGESDGNDYYERRDWSESVRQAEIPKLSHPSIPSSAKHTELTEGESVTGILIKHPPHNSNREKQSSEERRPRRPASDKPKHDDYDDDDEPEKSKPNLSEEQNESDLRKSQILDSVDDLKERHAMEQKLISEKVKEEAMYKEERERDKIRPEKFDKYNVKGRIDKPDYDDYDDTPAGDKYKFGTMRKLTTVSPTTSSNAETTTFVSTTPKNEQATVKLSVFRNPSAYIVYDEYMGSSSSTEASSETPHTTTEIPTRSKLTKANTRYSTKIASSPPKVKHVERISLVPQENELREGEPTLFFPKKRNSMHKKNILSEPTDSNVAGSNVKQNLDLSLQEVHDTTAAESLTAPSGTGLGGDVSATTGSESTETESSKKAPTTASQGSLKIGSASSEENSSESSERDQQSSTATTQLDVIPASSDHSEKKKDGDHHHEKGGETEHHAEQHSEHGESGKKAYEGEHEDTKTEKGHHDKEDHLGKYHDHGGVDKSHHDEKKHYGDHHHEEHGKKHAEYEESGKHSKGHSTKGSHDIHKKEEYEKKVEFFEEEGDSAEEEKHGAHSSDMGHKKGGLYKKGKEDAGYHKHAKGDSGQFNKHGHLLNHKGYNSAAGHDEHGKHEAAKATKTAGASGKKWIFHHGFPAKNANLVVIDRRADQLYHGPQYYG